MEIIIFAKYRCENFSKVMVECLKKTLPSLISSNQSAYANGRFISKGGRLISDLLEIRDTLELNKLLATIRT